MTLFSAFSSSQSQPSDSKKQPRKEKRKQIWDKRYDSARKGQRHNMKLPVEHRARFHEPFDAHLALMLDLLPQLHPTPPLPKETIQSAQRSSPHGCGWTIWISTELRERYRDIKQRYAPKMTHGEFVELLLMVKEEFDRVTVE
ncbi:hypothetical protein HK104_005560, partial [Borealophlyctis nickersoniae]